MDTAQGMDSAQDAAAAPRHRRVAVLLLVAAVVYGLDVLTKVLVVAKLANRPPVRLIGSLLELDYTRNPGAAFSLGVGYTIVFTAIAVGVVVVILRLARTLYSLPWAFALGLLLGGALGNLTDRIARSPGVFRGWVVDFIQVPHWPIFNIADSAITLGIVLLLIHFLLMSGKEMEEARPSASHPQPPGASVALAAEEAGPRPAE